MKLDEIKQVLLEYIEELNQILSRFKKDSSGIHIHSKDEHRILEITQEVLDLLKDEFVDYKQSSQMLGRAYTSAINTFLNIPCYSGVQQIQSVIKTLYTRLERKPEILKYLDNQNSINITKQEQINNIIKIIDRFHIIVKKIRKRYDNRATLEIEDEYDVQDLLHSLLAIYFDDIRPEEYTPSYASKSARMDFFLPEIETVIEIKKTRTTLNEKKVGEELLIDIARYKKHPNCKTLICFVYDPDGRISNPSGLENDLNIIDGILEVRVIIVPK
ncbi:hypothetical protein N5U20_08115 [Aliarcobacter butzleri]|uniref:PD-(D/E)XK nuclease domain-containing protein n=1 Tax=Aliarcobacter butzleri TaxID=28197 RepID=UPI0021B2E0C0|nr:hypothetical protein [Aliarcobacter butzleri]MCT7613175.1 hypothetical protein [Aliarcobacter butzleri]MCT7640302.1 hypothetical protein [Aliarcobacter butzleri]